MSTLTDSDFADAIVRLCEETCKRRKEAKPALFSYADQRAFSKIARLLTHDNAVQSMEQCTEIIERMQNPLGATAETECAESVQCTADGLRHMCINIDDLKPDGYELDICFEVPALNLSRALEKAIQTLERRAEALCTLN